MLTSFFAADVILMTGSWQMGLICDRVLNFLRPCKGHMQSTVYIMYAFIASNC